MVELTNKVVKCRVKHKCVWCGEFIDPMQKAAYRAGVYDGNFFSDYWHEECAEAAEFSDSEVGEFRQFTMVRGKDELR